MTAPHPVRSAKLSIVAVKLRFNPYYITVGDHVGILSVVLLQFSNCYYGPLLYVSIVLICCKVLLIFLLSHLSKKDLCIIVSESCCCVINTENTNPIELDHFFELCPDLAVGPILLPTCLHQGFQKQFALESSLQSNSINHDYDDAAAFCYVDCYRCLHVDIAATDATATTKTTSIIKKSHN